APRRGSSLVGLESIRLVDPAPRHLLSSLRQLVAAPRERLLRLEQLEPRREPLFPCPPLVLHHGTCLLPSGVGSSCSDPAIVGHEIHLTPGLRGVGVTSLAGFRWTR